MGTNAITWRQSGRHRAADEGLRSSEYLIRSMSANSPYGILLVDNRTDEIVFFNRRFCEIWGIEHLAEQMGRGELKNGDIIPYCLPILEDVSAFAESCEPLQSEENRAIIEDEIRFVDRRAIRRFSTQLRDENDRYIGRYYIFEDITERIRAAEEIERLNRELELSVAERTAQLRTANEEMRREIKERTKIGDALAQRLEYERTIAEISSRFAGTGDLDDAINDSLADIGRLTGASRGYLVLRDNYATMGTAHEWCSEGVTAERADLLKLASSTSPWWMSNLLAGDVIHITDVSAMPEEAAAEREILRAQGIKSIAAIPVAARGELLGFIGLDNVRGSEDWRVEDLVALRAVSDILAEVLERKRAEYDLHWEASVKSAIASLSAMMISASGIEDVASLVLDHARRLTGSAIGYVGYIDPATGYLVCPTMTGDVWESCQIRDKGIVFEETRGLCGWVLDNRQPLLTNAPTEHPASSGVPEGHPPIHRFLSVPALISGELVGQIAMANPGRDYTESDLKLLERLADHYALAVQREWGEAALRRSEERFRLIVTNSPDAVFYQDSHLRYTWIASPAMSPGEKEEAIRKTDAERFGETCPEEALRLTEIKMRVLETGIRARADVALPVGGKLRQFHSVYEPQLGPDGRAVGIFGYAHDITERKEAEEVLRQSEERFRSVVQAAREAIVCLDSQGTIVLWSRGAEAILGYSSEEVVGKSGTMVLPQRLRESYLKGIEQLAASGGETADIEKPVETLGLKKDGSEVPLEVTLAPLKTGEKPFFTVIARDIGERKAAERALRQSAEKLRRALEQTIQAMATSSEIRDPYTAGHQRQVAKLAMAIAVEMGLSQDEIDAVRMAAQIHDIGKLSIPAEILSRPGTLSEIELSFIKGHPQLGHEILKGIEFPWPIAEMVLQHHERLDGSGYPLGLFGEAILPGARILAVADVVEAMASHRPYRSALGLNAAVEEITLHRGTLYDSAVVDSCMRVIAKGGSSSISLV